MNIERPILFNSEMVRAIIAGRKTQTRRLLKPQPTVPFYCNVERYSVVFGVRGQCYNSPFFVEDLLYVRETWRVERICTGCKTYHYRADMDDKKAKCLNWRPSIHMPKEAARLWLKVSDVCVERLQHISYSDAMAEGVTCEPEETPREAFQRVWEKCYGENSWSQNPFVWVIKFEVVKK